MTIRSRLPRPMLRFAQCALAMTLLSILYTMGATYVLKLDYPYGLPLFFSDDRWFDFTIYHDGFQHFRSSAFWSSFDYPFTYPAPLALVYATLYKLPHALRFYLPACGAAVLAGGGLFVRALVSRGLSRHLAIPFTALLLLSNYPLRTLYESANTEGLVALLAGVGLYCVLRDRCWLGGAMIAIAGTMKIFPFILLALLLSKRRYREFVSSLAVAAVTTIVSLAIVGPSIGEAQRHIDQGLRYVKYWFIFSLNPAAVTFNHSLFTLVKFGVVAVERHLHPMSGFTAADYIVRAMRERHLLEATFNVYVVSAALFGLVLYFGWMRRLPLLNQVLALTSCELFLPPLSADYTLLHLLLPFALVCIYALEMHCASRRVPGLTACCLCFAPIFSFQTYITWRYRFSCEFRTLALLALLYVAMKYPFRWRAIDGGDVHEVLPATTSSF